MTPSEKAKDLILKFKNTLPRMDYHTLDITAKFSAIIVVEEIIADYKVFNEKHKSYKVPSFWETVLNEIKKM